MVPKAVAQPQRCVVCAPEDLHLACCRTIFGIWRVKRGSKGTLEDVLRVRQLGLSSRSLECLLSGSYPCVQYLAVVHQEARPQMAAACHR